MGTPVNFGTALRAFREERTLSLRELATLSAVDHTYIHRLESGDKTAPSPEVLDKLTRGLKLAGHKRRVLEILIRVPALDAPLFELAIEQPDLIELIEPGATMSFRGKRPTTKEEWRQKLKQIEGLLS